MKDQKTVDERPFRNGWLIMPYSLRTSKPKAKTLVEDVPNKKRIENEEKRKI